MIVHEYLLFITHDCPWSCVCNVEVILEISEKPLPRTCALNLTQTECNRKNEIIRINAYNCQKHSFVSCLYVAAINTNERPATGKKPSFTSIIAPICSSQVLLVMWIVRIIDRICGNEKLGPWITLP